MRVGHGRREGLIARRDFPDRPPGFPDPAAYTPAVRNPASILLCLLAAACGEAPSTADTPAPPPAGAPDALSVRPDPPELLEPGAAERRELRIHAPVGSVQIRLVTTGQRLERRMGEQVIQGATPPQVVQEIRLEVIERSPLGEMLCELSVLDMRSESPTPLPPQVEERVRQEVERAKSIRGQSVVTPGGLQSLVGQIAPADPRGALARMLVPLPLEPVGIGAKWRFRFTSESEGLSVEQVVDYELLEWTDAGAVVAFTERVSPAPGQLPVRSASPAGEVEVRDRGAISKGRVEFALDQVFPVRGEVESELFQVHGSPTDAVSAEVRDMILARLRLEPR